KEKGRDKQSQNGRIDPAGHNTPPYDESGKSRKRDRIDTTQPVVPHIQGIKRSIMPKWLLSHKKKPFLQHISAIKACDSS
ncbi:MAG: hypothetical protein ACRCVK_12235, partial [Aeromonas veronii]